MRILLHVDCFANFLLINPCFIFREKGGFLSSFLAQACTLQGLRHQLHVGNEK